MDPWQLLKDVKLVGPNELDAEARAPEGSPWFTGHFPGEPILPGIAILQAVYSAILRDVRSMGEDGRLVSLKRVRFTFPVRPGEKLDIRLNKQISERERVYTFKVTVGENLVCSGMAAVAAKVRDKKV